MILQKLRREISFNIHFTRRAEFSQSLSWLGIRTGDYICDIGSGDGYWPSNLTGADHNVIEVDIDELAPLRAEQFYGHIVEFISAPVERLPIGANTMDKVTSLCAMEHFLDDAMALAEIRRILRPRWGPT